MSAVTARSLADCSASFKNTNFSGLIDNVSRQDNNGAMLKPQCRRMRFVVILAVGYTTVGALAAAPALAASTIYYCSDRHGDQQYSATPGPGCVPLIDRPGSGREKPLEETPQREYHIDSLQQDVSAFLNRYRRFLDCCKADLHELRDIEDLADEVNGLLISVQTNLSNHALASKAIMLRELLSRVATARADLKTLRTRLERISEISRRRDQMDFEEAGRQSQEIRKLEESIERDIRAPRLPASAKTGAEIGVAPAAGPAIGRTPKTGAAIGREGLMGQDIGASPTSSHAIGESARSGFEIGSTGRPGPAIGESPLNEETSSSVNSTLQRSTVGSTISDSTVDSSLIPSNISSDMQAGRSSGGHSSLEGR